MSGAQFGEFLQSLYAVLEERRRTRPEGSYTAKLFDEGEDAILRKIAEETTEVLLAVKGGAADEKLPHDELVWEASDLLFHLLVLLVQRGVALDEIHAELDRRHKG